MISRVPPQLPLELYTHIIQFVVRRGDLFRVCLVSKYFLRDGQKWLYRENKIPMKLMARFSRSIINHAPLAALVRSLTLQFPGEWFDSHYNQAGEDLIDMMLKSLVNLRRLAILGLSPWRLAFLLNGCPFQLEAFETDISLQQPVLDILSQRYPRMSELIYTNRRLESLVIPPSFQKDILPRISVLETPAYLLNHIPVHSWAISRLKLDLTGYGIHRETALGDILKHFGSTLTSISLERRAHWQRGAHTLPMLILISEFASDTPNLEFIAASDISKPVGVIFGTRIPKLTRLS